MSGGSYEAAVEAFEAANAADPQIRADESGRHWPAQLLEARRLSAWVERLDPAASEALRLAAHCQHLERWTLPRSRYPEGRVGYKKWRSELARFHARRAREILLSLGYSEDVLAKVEAINLKRDIAADPDTQTMEDALCLVFLEFQLQEFAAKHAGEEEKLLRVLKKTWCKMSARARQAALELVYAPEVRGLIERALAGAATDHTPT